MANIAITIGVGSTQECIICGQVHVCDHIVFTRYKTRHYFSSECFEKEVANGKGKRNPESQTD